MKNKLYVICSLLITVLLLSTKTFAQRDAGGESSGSIIDGTTNIDQFTNPNCVIQPSPVSFKRNNGQGTCGGDAQIRLQFSQPPSEIPVLVGLHYTDGTPVNYIVDLPNPGIQGDASELQKKKYVSYCLLGGNIIPAKKLTAIFRYPGGCQADVVLHE